MESSSVERAPEGFTACWAAWEATGAKLVATRGALQVIREA